MAQGITPAQEARARAKAQKIIEDHPELVDALHRYIEVERAFQDVVSECHKVIESERKKSKKKKAD